MDVFRGMIELVIAGVHIALAIKVLIEHPKKNRCPNAWSRIPLEAICLLVIAAGYFTMASTALALAL